MNLTSEIAIASRVIENHRYRTVLEKFQSLLEADKSLRRPMNRCHRTNRPRSTILADANEPDRRQPLVTGHEHQLITVPINRLATLRPRHQTGPNQRPVPETLCPQVINQAGPGVRRVPDLPRRLGRQDLLSTPPSQISHRPAIRCPKQLTPEEPAGRHIRLRQPPPLLERHGETPPRCGEKLPKADFAAPGAKALAKQDIAALAALFPDNPLTGGQKAPRLYRWVNKDVAVFIQLDKSDPAEATALRYVGISVRGEFCKSKQPSADFPHFHRTHAAEYAKGHGQAPGDRGYWLLWMATDTFKQRDGRQVTPGVDREFSPTPPPAC